LLLYRPVPVGPVVDHESTSRQLVSSRVRDITNSDAVASVVSGEHADGVLTKGTHEMLRHYGLKVDVKRVVRHWDSSLSGGETAAAGSPGSGWFSVWIVSVGGLPLADQAEGVSITGSDLLEVPGVRYPSFTRCAGRQRRGAGSAHSTFLCLAAGVTFSRSALWPGMNSSASCGTNRAIGST
jgi:hypothetical protein